MTDHAPFLDRYRDTTPPTLRQALSDLVHRAFVPVLAVWVVVVAVGLLIVGPLNDLPGEKVVNEVLQDHRTPLLDSLTYAWSAMGDTMPMTAACVVIGAFIWWRTRQWWIAVIPGIALALEAFVFLTSSLIVGRGRPDVEHLDDSPPTSGYPSGHVGASMAFYVAVAFLVQRIRQPVLRWVLTVACLAMPFLIAFSRLYRGMHHATDVAVGALEGLACAFLAWGYLRRDPAATSDAGVAGSGEGVHAVRGEADRGQDQQRGAERQVGQRP